MKENVLLFLLNEAPCMFNVLSLRQEGYKVRAGGLTPASNTRVGAPVEAGGPSSPTPAEALLPLSSLWTCTETDLPPRTRCLLSWATRKVSASSSSRPEALPTHTLMQETRQSENNFQSLLFSIMKIGHSSTNQLWKYELLSKWKNGE